ncbi:hypothetical protein SUGI_0779960 [Cryptomeria japonica]|nr:hypothetical protein SUGI_0779960 [Cryptomeria japonica]
MAKLRVEHRFCHKNATVGHRLHKIATTVMNNMALGDQGFEPPIFLCHSGAQKNFTEQLWVDLQDQNRHAFMDIHSLPDGECFQNYIYEAAAKCQVGVFVLSEEFFSKSIWPMHELQTFLQKNSGENHRLLPLFFGISPDHLKDPENERRWVRIWEDWATKDERVDVSFWRYALRVLKSHNGVVFQQGMREVEYRRMIVQCICEIVPHYFTADLSYVQGGDRIRQELMNKMNQLPCKGTRLPSGTQILPVYGTSGMGKTTLCKIMCNYFQRRCRVCHIQVGANCLDYLSQQKIVLRQLTGASESLLQDLTDTDVAQNLLIRRIGKQRVFLAIDDVCTEESSVGMIRRNPV